MDAPHVWVLEDGTVFVCLTERERREGERGNADIRNGENNYMERRQIVDGYLVK